MVTTKSDLSPRDRLLQAADELFYEEGVHTVGIDRVIERAGVAKASLYGTFGSKEELVRAYLEQRLTRRQERIRRKLEAVQAPRARILAVFDVLGEVAAEPTFRGCAFINASAEGPRGEARSRQVCLDSRAWTRELLTGLARDLGVRDPARLGARLALLYDGAIVGASMDGDPGRAKEARAMAELLIDAQEALPAARAVARARPARRAAPRGA